MVGDAVYVLHVAEMLHEKWVEDVDGGTGWVGVVVAILAASRRKFGMAWFISQLKDIVDRVTGWVAVNAVVAHMRRRHSRVQFTIVLLR